MVEATEIAKLRLFLKMVAVVDVDRKADNLGLDPLPDIDFNIRCGNTLVGYANQKQLDNDLAVAKDIMEELANQEFKEKIDEELIKVAAADRLFKKIQMEEDDNIEAFKHSKYELKSRLSELNDSLNHRLYLASGSPLPYEAWLSSHQPFNWLAEFYQIMQGNGGFDVIIGNPPYIEFPSNYVNYSFNNLKSANCGNLYGCCIERGYQIGNKNGKFSFIIPVAITCSKRMSTVIDIMKENSDLLVYANFDDRPGKLFEMLQHLRATIFISCRSSGISTPTIYSTKYNRWYTQNRPILFTIIKFVNVSEFVDSYIIPKFSYAIECDINRNRMCSKACTAEFYSNTSNSNNIYYRAAGGGYFLLIKTIKSETYINGVLEEVKAEKAISISLNYSNNSIGALLSSSFFYWSYIAYTDCRNLTKTVIDNFPCPKEIGSDIVLTNIGKELFKEYESKSNKKDTYYQSTGRNVIYWEYYPKLSKSILDEIDRRLASLYNFTEPELDFIINYDIKYRMGDELNSED